MSEPIKFPDPEFKAKPGQDLIETIQECGPGRMGSCEATVKYTEADLQSRLALFAGQVAEHQLFVVDSLWYQCTCGKRFHWKAIDGVPKPSPEWKQHILSLVPDPNAITAHDAALREDATHKEHISHLEFEAELFATLIDPVEDGALHEAEFREVMLKAARDQRETIYRHDENLQKLKGEMVQLQADNAGLRAHFCSCDSPYFGAQPVGTFKCERCGKCYDKEARALLGEKP